MKKFKKVYFRINTPSYYRNKYGIGFEDQQASEYFNNFVAQLFLNEGWEIKEKRITGGCDRATKDKQELYFHPQSFSGVVLEENIQLIEHLLSNNDLFKFEKTDIYEDVYDLSNEEYIDILKLNQLEIEKDILNIYKTKRSNLYITDTWIPLKNVLDKHRIKRLSHYVGVLSSSDIDYKFICELFEKLISEGKIVTAQCKNGEGYRTINKTEQKKLKFCLQ